MKTIIALVVSLISFTAEACTVFCVSSADKAFFASNEDYKNPETRVWFKTGDNEKLGVIYFGFDDLFPQGGMNQAGLSYDGLATKTKPVTKSLQKPKKDLQEFLEHIMSNCKTVDEVIAEFENVNRVFLNNAMLMFADSSGHSAIFEGDEILLKTDSYQVATNFYLSETPSSKITCSRYLSAQSILSNAKDAPSTELCKSILDETKQSGSVMTLYSVIYDMKQRKIHIYNRSDFSREHVLRLDDELKKGNRTIELKQLFENKM